MSNTIVNPGVYETLISQAIEDKLKELPDSKYYIQKEGIDSAESYKMLAEYLTEIVSGILKSYFRLKDSKETISAQVDVVNRILKFIEQEWNTQGIETSLYQLSEEDKLMFLRGIYSKPKIRNYHPIHD
ncbi:MAG: hypothetical protein MR541_06380 [Prevotella sp.]|nr:hypothetical protein [Prevotella sp.]